jgi:hypothetical protein
MCIGLIVEVNCAGDTALSTLPALCRKQTSLMSHQCGTQMLPDRGLSNFGTKLPGCWLALNTQQGDNLLVYRR